MEQKPVPLIFVSGPYSKENQAHNVHNACLVGAFLITLGGTPIVPHTSIIADTIAPMPYERWLSLDKALLTHCSALIRIPGNSPGADGEVEMASQREIPCYFHPSEYLGANHRDLDRTDPLLFVNSLRYLIRLYQCEWAEWALEELRIISTRGQDQV